MKKRQSFTREFKLEAVRLLEGSGATSSTSGLNSLRPRGRRCFPVTADVPDPKPKSPACVGKWRAFRRRIRF